MACQDMFRVGRFGLNPVEKGQEKDLEYIFTFSQTTVHSQLTKCRVDILDDLWAAGAVLVTKGLVVSQMLSTPQG